MTEKEFAELLASGLIALGGEVGDLRHLERSRSVSFEKAGLLTHAQGVRIWLDNPDGQMFDVIVQEVPQEGLK